METLAHDVRYALRSLARRPGFAAVVVLTLALGFGANAALFSVVDAVLLRPLPFAAPGELVQVWERHDERGRPTNVVSPANFADSAAGPPASRRSRRKRRWTLWRAASRRPTRTSTPAGASTSSPFPSSSWETCVRPCCCSSAPSACCS